MNVTKPPWVPQFRLAWTEYNIPRLYVWPLICMSGNMPSGVWQTDLWIYNRVSITNNQQRFCLCSCQIPLSQWKILQPYDITPYRDCSTICKLQWRRSTYSYIPQNRKRRAYNSDAPLWGKQVRWMINVDSHSYSCKISLQAFLKFTSQRRLQLWVGDGSSKRHVLWENNDSIDIRITLFCLYGYALLLGIKLVLSSQSDE